MRITNVNTLSALIDRLITENIKLFFFEKDGLIDKVNHQRLVIASIRSEMENLFEDAIRDGGYDYIGEQRTFVSAFPTEITKLIFNDIRIGEADRARLEEVTKDEPDFYRMAFNEIRLRMSNEERALNKNVIDCIAKEIFKPDNK